MTMLLFFHIAATVCSWRFSGFLVILAVTAASVAAEDSEQPAAWRAGASSSVITPQRSMRMAGYASRTEPSEGTEQELFAKALAVEDGDGRRVVIITLDLIGVLDRLRTAVEERVQEKYQVPPEALLINASHTHCGPAYGREEVQDYFDFLVETLVETVGQALERLEPASLSYSRARCSVAMNRRTPTAGGYRNHPNPNGPVDHTVPVLSVKDSGGRLRAVLFGYACHNTTMSFRKWLGDYAGFAQEFLEQDHPGVTALFLMGCGGDQNPYPRSELHYANKHGRSLATSVEAALEVNQRTPLHQHPVRGTLQFALETVDLEHTTSERPPFAYPVQVIKFGEDLTLIALATEVVVDYSIRLKQELEDDQGPAIWVAGYSNTYHGYIPSKRILLEGGYEASRPYQPDVEDRIVGKVLELNGRLETSKSPVPPARGAR